MEFHSSRIHALETGVKGKAKRESNLDAERQTLTLWINI